MPLDGGGGLTSQSVRVTRVAVQSIPNAVTTTVVWTSEVWDDYAIHDLIVNPSRLTAQIAGKYLAVLMITFDNNNVGLRQLSVYKNGAQEVAVIFPNAVAGEDQCQIMAYCELAIGDYVEAKVWQNSGAALDIDPGTSWFGMARLDV